MGENLRAGSQKGLIPRRGSGSRELRSGMNMKELIAFIVFLSVSCMVAAVSALWERGRRFVQAITFARQTIKKRYGNI